ncbi:MAG: hypothetical protein WKF77_00880 [Planctomycetaceae bacterium]
MTSSGTLKGNATVGGQLSNQGNLSPGNSPGIVTVNGNYTQTSSGTLNIEIAGTNPATPDFDQVIVSGTVTLAGALNVSLLSGFIPASGNSFRIIDNDGTDSIVGTFASLGEGATLVAGVRAFRISYVGGTGNDVVLTALNNNTFIVSSTTDSGAGSLRQAILDANATPNGDIADRIVFSITGSGAQTISPISGLPGISDTLTIDATTQPGYAGTPLVVISGASAGNVYGVVVNGAGAAGSVVRGLVINQFQLSVCW